MQPVFHRQRLSRYVPWMVECAERCRMRWRDGAVLDVHDEMMSLPLAVVGRALFGDDFGRDASRISEAMRSLLAAADLREEVLTLVRLRLRLPVPAQTRLLHARDILASVIRRLIEERQRSGDEREDLLSLLMTARDTENDGGAMSAAQLLDECATLLLAGHETTASALTFTFYLLSQHPSVEAQLHVGHPRATVYAAARRRPPRGTRGPADPSAQKRSANAAASQTELDLKEIVEYKLVGCSVIPLRSAK